jgi:hypothetical protein
MTGTELTRQRRRTARRIRQIVALRRLTRTVTDAAAPVADDAVAPTDA